MSKLLRFAFHVTIFILLLNPSLLFAADDIYDAPGIDTHRETLSSIPEEHIDPFTGGLTLNHVDARLPGNGGLDFVIQRSFNSKSMCDAWSDYPSWNCFDKGEKTWMGFGWKLHFGRAFISPSPAQGPHFVEMPDGSRHVAYNKAGTPGTYITKDYWLLRLEGSYYTLTLTNGTKIYFNQNTGFPEAPYNNYSHYLATKIEDVNGNQINITYQNIASNIVPNYADDSTGRRIYFYYTTVNNGLYLTRISGPGIDIDYAYDPITNLYGAALLKDVTFPVGSPWAYTYDKTLMDLRTVTSPYGGIITYIYAMSSISACDWNFTYRTVTEKQNSGRELPTGSWTFTYSQGTNKEYTQISDPCGRTLKYGYYGYGSTLSTGEKWKYGLPKSKEIVGEEKITYAWKKISSVSIDDYIIPYCGRDYDIYIPLLDSKAIVRDEKTYTTSYPSYDSYGNPKTISEAATGDKTRTTSIPQYWYDTSKNIVQNKPLSETVTGGFPGSFTTTYEYYSTTGKVGNLKKVTRYGVATEYDYYTDDLTGHGKGNLKWSKDANLKTTNYQWDKGKIKLIQTPEYTIDRVINDNGTIYSTTDGRSDAGNHITVFDYDGNLRLQSIDPPAGNTTSFFYQPDNSYKKETRGNFDTFHYYDGFGRPKKTVDEVGIETEIAYKSCGLKDYTTSNIGDTIYYDNFGRVEQIKHIDNSTIDYTYLGSKVTVSDEESNDTQLTYNAFGNPDERLLVSVKDALDNTTIYDYNILGSITSIDQSGISRTFHYNSKNFLDYETHPEKGTINYPLRDGVGNMKSKQDSLGTTSYTYDGVNRLKAIDYGTGTISFNYDGANNRTLMDNPNANIDYTYHENNLLWTKTEIILGKPYTTRYEYDGNDNLTDIYYPSGRHVQYSYNEKNQVTSVTQFGGSINNISYNTTGTSLGLLKSFTCSNGKTTNLAYTSRNFMETIHSGSSILNLLYTYNDKRGNLTSINDYLNSANSQFFTYDELNRLRIFNGSWGTGTYNYYFSGNRSSKVVAGVTTTYNYTNNRLTSTTGGESSSFSYNTNGDATGVSGYTLDYDRLHNLISYKQGSTPIAEFTYDGDGMRVTKTSGGTTTVYHYDKEGKVLSENNGSGTLIADYVYLNGKLAAKIANDTFLVPNAPTNLTAGTVSASQINLSWTDNASDETGFKIERKIGSGGTYAQIATVVANVTTYSDSGLTANTTYYYRVKANNAAGDSAYSNEAYATTSTAPPVAPTNLTATAISSSQINISWTDNASDETGFKIERKIGSGGTYSQIAAPAANTTSYSDPGLTSGTTYYYRVRANNAAGDSAYSNEAYATTSCANLPVRIARATPVYYSSLQAAYNAAVNGDIIQSRSGITFTENISVNRNISVTLQGGYDCNYTTNSGNISLLKGMIQTFVGGGTLTIGNFNLIQ